LVSTHDQALADIDGPLNGQLYNVHFPEEFENGRVIFDYKVREGVVTKNNGSGANNKANWDRCLCGSLSPLFESFSPVAPPGFRAAVAS